MTANGTRVKGKTPVQVSVYLLTMGVSSTIDVHTGDGGQETFKPTLIGSILNSNSPSDPATFRALLVVDT